MTVSEVQKALRPLKKVSVKQVRVYIKNFGIQPLGIRQRPQNYPDDAPEIIARHLGVSMPSKKAA